MARTCTQEKIRETPSPTLFLHGLKDEVVPHSHSLDLYKASCAKQKVGSEGCNKCLYIYIYAECSIIEWCDGGLSFGNSFYNVDCPRVFKRASATCADGSWSSNTRICGKSVRWKSVAVTLNRYYWYWWQCKVTERVIVILFRVEL